MCQEAGRRNAVVFSQELISQNFLAHNNYQMINKTSFKKTLQDRGKKLQQSRHLIGNCRNWNAELREKKSAGVIYWLPPIVIRGPAKKGTFVFDRFLTDSEMVFYTRNKKVLTKNQVMCARALLYNNFGLEYASYQQNFYSAAILCALLLIMQCQKSLIQQLAH